MKTFITDGKEGWFKWETAFNGLYIYACPDSHLTLPLHGMYYYYTRRASALSTLYIFILEDF